MKVVQDKVKMVNEMRFTRGTGNLNPSWHTKDESDFSFQQNLFNFFSGHFASEEVNTKLNDLNQKWDSLKAKAAQRRQDLEDSLQAQQYFADANEAESWMREKEPVVGSIDYGKDEDSAEVWFFVSANIVYYASSVGHWSWEAWSGIYAVCRMERGSA